MERRIEVVYFLVIVTDFYEKTSSTCDVCDFLAFRWPPRAPGMPESDSTQTNAVIALCAETCSSYATTPRKARTQQSHPTSWGAQVIDSGCHVIILGIHVNGMGTHVNAVCGMCNVWCGV